MLGEFGQSRAQLKGYLFEMFLMALLEKNGFIAINSAVEPRERVRQNRENFIEMKGRGCWHQIDCPCDYRYLIPFSFPLRLLGEAKFYARPLEKKHIRSFIGVIKDIQENYFVADDVNLNDNYPRRMEIGVYFAANGFQAEAEKLAYAHGIKTVSYANNPLIDQIKKWIIILERNYLSVECMKNGNWGEFQHQLFDLMRRYRINYNMINHQLYWADGYQNILQQLFEAIHEIQSSFIGTTSTGVFLHFVGKEEFPEDLFRNSDEAWCKVYYYEDDFRIRYFWLELSEDFQRRRFYFTPPESLDQAAVFGNDIALGEKERLFRTLNVNIQLHGINRNLNLHIDRDWLEAIRNGNHWR